MSDALDRSLAHIEAGGDLDHEALVALAASPDILAAGMLADARRARLHGRRATFLRVTLHQSTGVETPEVEPAAAELRLVGVPATVADARTRLEAARAVAAHRTLTAFTWADVARLSTEAGQDLATTLRDLQMSGMDGLAEVAVDQLASVDVALAALADAGFQQVRLHVARAASSDARLAMWARVAAAHERFGHIASISPLPLAISAFKPTTGYDDVKAVALARLAVPRVPHVQVDWQRYGPKLAQVALTFGADDVDAVSASDEAPLGRRRAALEEIRRNIEAAGFEPVERSGRFAVP